MNGLYSGLLTKEDGLKYDDEGKIIGMPDYAVAWGARTIPNHTYGKVHNIDIVNDRHTGFVGEGRTEEVDRDFQDFIGDMLDWLKTAMPFYDGSSHEVYRYDRGGQHFRASANGSYGYIYITAWQEESVKARKAV